MSCPRRRLPGSATICQSRALRSSDENNKWRKPPSCCSEQDVRLLSLTGPGGAGKTRLAIAVAAAIADRFTAGVQFVSLASITQPDLVATALADALEIQQVANRTIPQLIGDQLQNSGPFLLLLDNFEQVLPAATVVAETLEACPSLKILVTSRSCLRIYGEQEFPVTPLAQNSAIELFAQRAAAVWPDFAITSENAPAIREICSRLDGLPLAIELAAARTKVLSPSAILDRLQSRLQLLTGGALDLPERQQTLRKTIDWSHDLLNEAERKLFRRLSVFVGGCTLEAAEAVCNTSRDLGIDLFRRPVILWWIRIWFSVWTEPRPSRVSRCWKRFANMPSNASRIAVRKPATRRAHAAYCLVLAEEGNPELSSADRARWLTQCDVEIDNFRSALDWLFQTLDLDWGLRLCVALFRFWDMREHLSGGPCPAGNGSAPGWRRSTPKNGPGCRIFSAPWRRLRAIIRLPNTFWSRASLFMKNWTMSRASPRL